MIELNRKLIKIVDKIKKDDSNFVGIVTMNSNFKDELGFDSLDEVEFIMELELNFDITISDDFAEEMTNKIVFLKDVLPILKDKFGIFDVKQERKEKIKKLNDEFL